MSQIHAELNDNELIICCDRARMTENDRQVIDIRTLQYGKKYSSYVKLRSQKGADKIILFQEMEIEPLDGMEISLDGASLLQQEMTTDVNAENEERASETEEELLIEHKVLFVYTDKKKVYYGYMQAANFYKLIVKYTYKVLSINLKNGYLNLKILSYLQNPCNQIQIESTRFYIDEKNNVESDIKVYPEKIGKKKVLADWNYQHIRYPLADLLTDETQLNNMLLMMVTINGIDVDFRIGKKEKKIPSKRMYYAPYKATFFKNFAIHLRRTDRGNFAIVKRPMEAIEYGAWFKFIESRPVSWLFYHLGKICGKLGRKNINLFYEKFAEKAEEGTFDLFQMAQKEGNSKCYYVISPESPDYEKIKTVKGVVKKYSFKYYWLLYNVSNYISTEAPAHLNILRSNNKYFRLATCEHPFIFLQHGITYLKCQGPSSTFVLNKEGEPAYMVVGSQKELDVCADMLKLSEERFLNTGLPIFSKIQYKHIDESSPDKVVIMLTWKSYEEHIQEFTNSEYYQNVMSIYHMLERYMAAENIIIVPHPKMASLCENTPLKQNMWEGPISEVLQYAKLLITDYSSVCYNSFYQGGGVIFFQPDLVHYQAEAGELIPADDEYIGYRVFNLDELEKVIEKAITDGKIRLETVRNKEFEKRYLTINEYHDGKNIERIAIKLKELNII